MVKKLKKRKITIKKDKKINHTKQSELKKTPKKKKEYVGSLLELGARKKVKSKNVSRVRTPTGIPGLDHLIQGGFKEGSINLIEGGPGSGKTIFAAQFLLDGLKKGEPVAYITFEVIKEKFYENMKILGLDMESYEKKGLFYFLAYTPEQIKKILLEGGGTIDTLIHQKKIKRLVIDSITSFALLYANELAKKEAALTLFNLINTWDCTALLTAQEEGNVSHGEVVSAALDFEVDGIIILYFMKNKSIRKRGLEVLKMRGTKTPDKVFNMEITQHGIKVGKSKYSI